MVRGKYTISLVGPETVGKKTLAGNLVYKLNGVDLDTLGRLEKDSTRKYDQILPAFKEMNKQPVFQTRENDILIVDASEDRDCTILVASFDTAVDDIVLDKEKFSKRPLICALNKMDTVEWKVERYDHLRDQIMKWLQSIGIDPTKVLTVPVSALTGDNLVWPSEKASSIKASDTGLAQPQEATLVGHLDFMLKSKTQK